MLNKQNCLLLISLTIFSVLAAGHEHHNAVETQKSAINSVIDKLHEAASRADLTAYLGAFTENGVFMGTDDWERWSRPNSLDKYVAERFEGGKGWTYQAVERNIMFNDSLDLAWFDEITVSQKWGRFRGTGVVVKQQGEWKIAHYSMSVLVANEAFFDIADINKKAFKERAKNKNLTQ